MPSLRHIICNELRLVREMGFFDISRILVTATTQMEEKSPKQTQTNLKCSNLILDHPELTKNSVVPELVWIY